MKRSWIKDNWLKCGFIVIVFVTVALGAASVWAILSITDGFDRVLGRDIQGETLALEAESLLQAALRGGEEVLLPHDEKTLARTDEALENMKKESKRVERLGLSDEITQEAGRVEKSVEDYRKALHEVVRITEKRKSDVADFVAQARKIEALIKSHRKTERARDLVTLMEQRRLDHNEEMMLRMRREEKDYLLDGDKKHLREVKTYAGQLKEGIHAAASVPDSEKAQADKMLEDYLGRFEDILTLDAEIRASKKHFQEIASVMEENLQTIKKQAQANSDAVENELNATSGVMEWVVIVLSVLAVLISAVLGYTIVRKLIGSITHGVEQLNEASEQMTVASQELAVASSSLSEGATEQASSLEETSASLEEVSSMSRQNSENAKLANDLASKASEEAASGKEAIEEMVEAMGEINDSSEKIAGIIKVIDEIAFQTNLLALNAAVEAARAGEHGKGFAVVAEEVRNLAQRSAEAAKDTATLIEDSVSKSKNGSVLASNCGGKLAKIVEGVEKVATLLGEITAASKEQAEGVSQVNEAVSQMDQVTQRSAATAEETAASSEELSAQAEEVRKAVTDLGRLVGLVIESHAAPAPKPTARAGARPAPSKAAPAARKVKAAPANGHGAPRETADEPALVAAGGGSAFENDEFFKEF